jgi:hypothetical protein
MSICKGRFFIFMRIAIFFLLLILAIKPSAQEQEPTKQADTTTLQYALRKGRFDAHFRLYYMTTNNERPLTDYYALAFGGGVKYETGKFKHFQVGVGGFFTWNLSSSNLAIPDSITGVKNRYEIGQFDMEDPENKNDMDRLEDFYLKYSNKRVVITFGKQVIQTPFVNPQDGRMRPTGEQGLWTAISPSDKLKLYGGWLTKISPRGTVRWFDIDESIGVYPSGVNTKGGKSNYKGNLQSSGIGILGGQYTIRNGLSVQLWEQYTDRLFNTIMIQADGEWKTGTTGKLIGGVQYTFQNPLKDGGNADPAKTYFDPEQKSQVFSLRGGYQFKENIIRINATRITADGRFLMPREWGREPFYTFLPRERNEGSGDVKAVTINFLKTWPLQRIKMELGYGYYDLPDVKNYRLNKYLMPSYHHFLADLKYSFAGFMNGLNAEILYVYKKDAANTYEDPKYVINKVNMHHLNIIINYYF